MTLILIYCLIAWECFYIVFLGRDLYRHRRELAAEPGSPLAIALTTCCVQFFASFGMSDFNLSIPVFRAAKWVDDRRLPGTLMSAAIVPAGLIAILYLTDGAVDVKTLLCCLIGQTAGAFVAGGWVAKLNGDIVRRVMGAALVLSAIVLVVKMVSTGSGGGTLTGFPVKTLLWLTPVYFILGILNTMGFGVKAVSIALLLTMGLSADCVLLIAIVSCFFCSSCGAIQLIAHDRYQRKIAAISSVAGLVGVVIGATLVKSLSITVLQWIMVAVMLYTAYTMLKQK